VDAAAVAAGIEDELRAVGSPARRRRNPVLARGVDPGMARAHEITITPARLHVVVAVDGEKVAESDRPVVLDETGLPPRYYLPVDDVRTDLLRATASRTTCPFKGEASYWSVEVGGKVYDDLVWSYESPIPAAEGVAGLLCFYSEKVDLTVDGVAA
jgi:uncharacterized protein (DUF427 family)